MATKSYRQFTSYIKKAKLLANTPKYPSAVHRQSYYFFKNHRPNQPEGAKALTMSKCLEGIVRKVWRHSFDVVNSQRRCGSPVSFQLHDISSILQNTENSKEIKPSFCPQKTQRVKAKSSSMNNPPKRIYRFIKPKKKRDNTLLFAIEKLFRMKLSANFQYLKENGDLRHVKALKKLILNRHWKMWKLEDQDEGIEENKYSALTILFDVVVNKLKGSAQSFFILKHAWFDSMCTEIKLNQLSDSIRETKLYSHSVSLFFRRLEQFTGQKYYLSLLEHTCENFYRQTVFRRLSIALKIQKFSNLLLNHVYRDGMDCIKTSNVILDVSVCFEDHQRISNLCNIKEKQLLWTGFKMWERFVKDCSKLERLEHVMCALRYQNMKIKAFQALKLHNY